MPLSQLEFLKHIQDECYFIIKVTKGKTFEQLFHSASSGNEKGIINYYFI
jgi:hypothetical protein